MTLPSSLPTARTPDPMDAPSLRWGVIGPGWIAERFTQALQRSTRQQVLAVASRSADRSAAFAARAGIDRAYGSYEQLVADPDVDVVYVATPHNAHHPCARLALDAGKHTLVEKPLALNAAQVHDLAAAAERAGVFCMEAMWTLFLPKYDVLRRLLDDGALGQVCSVVADHGEHFGPEHRIQRADLAGGPLLDLGTYPIALATWVLGAPERVLATGQPAPSGVNGQASILLAHAGGEQSVLHTTILSDTPTGAFLAGTDATLTLPHGFYLPGSFRLAAHGGGPALEYQEEEVRHAALHFQAAHVAECIAAGRTRSPLRPLDASLTMISVVDEVRRQLGIVFDEER